MDLNATDVITGTTVTPNAEDAVATLLVPTWKRLNVPMVFVSAILMEPVLVNLTLKVKGATIANRVLLDWIGITLMGALNVSVLVDQLNVVKQV